MKKRIGLFPGTFDPFTVGHSSLVKRSLVLVDELIIAIGVNETKQSYFSIERRLEMIRGLYKDEPRITVKSYDGLTMDFAEKEKTDVIIRGIRSNNDFEFEKNIADVNRAISGIETVILFTEPELTHISSTIVRELLRYGRDVSRFIPPGIDVDRKN